MPGFRPRRRARVAASLALLLGAGLSTAHCHRPATGALVELDTDAPRAQLVSVEAVARRGSLAPTDAPADHAWDDAGAIRPWPASFGLVPGADAPADPVVTLLVTARFADSTPGGGGGFTLRRMARFSFAPGATLRVPVFLAAGCASAAADCAHTPPESCTVAARCEELGQTCGDDARCAPVDVTPAPIAPSDTTGPDADAPAPCPGNRTRCGELCADLASNAAHCGACGHPCALGCVSGQCAVLAAVLVGDGDVVVRTSGGALYGAGLNTDGELVPYTAPSETRMVPLRADLGVATQYAQQEEGGCVLRGDGSVACWGGSHDHQLDAIGGATRVPTVVPGLPPLARLFAGDFTMYGVTAAGEVWAWGDNGSGQHADGTTGGSGAPVAVPALRGVRAIAVDQVHACAIDATGTPECWGTNAHGQLGDGTTTSRAMPVRVMGRTDVAEFALAYEATCARYADGTVGCWGSNEHGQLGDGTTTDRATPAPVPGLQNVRAIAMGEQAAYAIVGAAGEVYAWGANGSHQLAQADANDRTAPVPIPGLRGITQIAAGYHSACARRDDGAVLCWGLNDHAQLANGTMTEVAVPSAPMF